ncbi:MAG: hypothetical protein NDI62_03030 [Burkholderiales bacterium]|nr:hypothetical protein [Burkholderiales bacterium]
MNKFKITYSILAVLFGIFMFVYGGYDDSPGAQLLGFVLFVAGIFLFRREVKKNK